MHCPVCRADVEQGPNCRRCRADLSLLFVLEEERQYVLARSAGQLQQGNWETARVLAEGAETLRNGEESRRLVAISALLGGDFARAWLLYTNGRISQESS
jgi:hypothetical protein